MRVASFALVAFSSLALLVSPASAQMFSNLAGQRSMNNLIMANVNQRGQQSAHREEQRQSNIQAAPNVAIANFRYSPSLKVRQQNIRNFSAIMRRTGDAHGAAALEALGPSAIDQLDQFMRGLGLSANNVADAYTFWWVIAWNAAHGKEAQPDAAIMRAVKKQAETALSGSPAFASASDSKKQELAEAFLLQAALVDAAVEDAAGNQSKMAEVAEAVNRGAINSGIDMKSMTLTRNGFISRSGGRSDATDTMAEDSQLAANEDGAQADGASMGDYALYAVAGTGLLAGMFALGKGFSKKG